MMTSAAGDGPGTPPARTTDSTLTAKEAQYDIVKATQVCETMISNPLHSFPCETTEQFSFQQESYIG